MIYRKLCALGYPVNKGNCHLKEAILWLERSNENSDGWKDVLSDDSQVALRKYLDKLSCPLTDSNNQSALFHWLLSYYTKREYAKNARKYNGNHTEEMRDTNKCEVDAARSGPLIDKINIPSHPDREMMLKTTCQLLAQRLVLEQPTKRSKSTKMHMDLGSIPSGFASNDACVIDAARIIRLLHLNKARHLQNEINSVIVHMQKKSAHPKIDESLGR